MLHILLLSRNQSNATPDGQQIMPFFMHRAALETAGIRVTNTPTTSPQERTGAIRAAFDSGNPPGVVLVMPHWSEEPDELARWFDETRSLITPARLMMLDYYAPTCSPHFGVLPYVDRYIKRQVLRDRSLYQNDYLGGFIYADFVSRTWGFDLNDWFFGSKPDPAHMHKLVAGWNLGITPRYRRMLAISKLNPLPWSMRPVDVHLRVGVTNRSDKPQEWYQFSRGKALESVRALTDSQRLSGSGRVSSKRYYAELNLSRVVLSPFGWGEVCFRDYEAVVSGALLVKPDMSHLETHPDIYQPDETYLALSWDMHDAADRVREVLGDPTRAKRMIRAGRTSLDSYYREARFVDLLQRCLAISEQTDSTDRKRNLT